MLFLRNFKELEIGFSFFEHYHKFVECYVIIIISLIWLKIEGFKEFLIRINYNIIISKRTDF